MAGLEFTGTESAQFTLRNGWHTLASNRQLSTTLPGSLHAHCGTLGSTPVLIKKYVFPHIQRQDRLANHISKSGGILVLGRYDFESRRGLYEKHPSRAKDGGSLAEEQLLEGVHVAKLFHQACLEWAVGQGGAARGHGVKVESVVDKAAAVVAQGLVLLLGQQRRVLERVFGNEGHQVVRVLGGCLGDERQHLVEVGHVGVKVLLVVQMHRLSVNVRLQRVKAVLERGERFLLHR